MRRPRWLSIAVVAAAVAGIVVASALFAAVAGGG
jgi:hypothetical protein